MSAEFVICSQTHRSRMIEDQVELSNAPNPTYADKFDKKMHLGLLGLSDFYRLIRKHPIYASSTRLNLTV